MAKRGRKLLVLTRPVDFDELEQEIRSARREKMPRYLERLQSLRALAQGDSRKKVANRVGRHPRPSVPGSKPGMNRVSRGYGRNLKGILLVTSVRSKLRS